MNSDDTRTHRHEADTFDLRGSLIRVWEACYAHKMLVLATTAVTVSVVIAYIVIWPPIFKAEVLVAADHDEDTSREDFYRVWNVFRKEDPASEVHLMTSRPVLEEVARTLELTYDDVHHPFLNYAGYLWTESWVGKRYRAVKEAIIPPKPMPFAPTEEEIELAKTLMDFRSGVALVPAADANVGRLVVKGPSPRVAEIANTVISTYLDQRRAHHVQEADTARRALASEVETALREVIAIEERMRAYYSEQQLILDFEKDKVEVAEWLKLRSSLVEAEAMVAGLLKHREEVASQLASEDPEIVSARVFQHNALRETMKTVRFHLQARLNEALIRYQPESPEIRDIEQQLAGVEALIGQEAERVEASNTRVVSETYETLRLRLQTIDAELASARAALDVRRAAADEIESRLEKIPEDMRAVHALGREQSILEKKYMILRDKLTMAEVSMATAVSAPPSLRVVEYAQPPFKPSWPNKKVLLLAALVAGFGAGCGLAFVLDMISGRVTRARLAAQATAAPVYATLGLVHRTGRSPAGRVLSSAGASRNGGHTNGAPLR